METIIREESVFRIMDAMQGAKVCCIDYGNVKKGGKVLILTDTKADQRKTEVVACVCREVGAEVTIIVMEVRELPNQEPPRAVVEAMKASDIVFANLFYTVSHTNARFEAMKTGTRYMGMYDSSIDALASEGARFPAEIIFAVTKKVAEQWWNGKTIHITCDKGTDIRAKITDPANNLAGWEGCCCPLGEKPYLGKDKENFPEVGYRGLFGNFAGGFGVVGMWPNWTAEGVIYFDCAHTFPGRLKTPVKYTVEKGRVVKFEGDPEQVRFYERILERFGPNAAHLAEFMIGLDPKARIYLDDPTHMEAHRHAGCLHCAIGQSVDAKRSVSPGIHLDNLIIEPTIKIDNQICVDKGKLMVYYEDPDILALLKKHNIKL